MTDEPTGGYERDLRDAENAMIAAGHPDVALQMRRHSEAIRNYMQGAIVPMFVEMVERVLDKKIDPVVALLEVNARQMGKIESDLRNQNKRLGAQIKALVKDIAAIKVVIAARPAERAADQQRLEARLAGMEARLAALEARG